MIDYWHHPLKNGRMMGSASLDAGCGIGAFEPAGTVTRAEERRISGALAVAVLRNPSHPLRDLGRSWKILEQEDSKIVSGCLKNCLKCCFIVSFSATFFCSPLPFWCRNPRCVGFQLQLVAQDGMTDTLDPAPCPNGGPAGRLDSQGVQ